MDGYGCAIGGNNSTNMIIINGGNIEAYHNSPNNYRQRIGSYTKINNLIINGGNIKTDGYIGGPKGDNITITGGNIIATAEKTYPAIGFNSNSNTEAGNITITGGTITPISKAGYALQTFSGNITITGGSVNPSGKLGRCSKYDTDSSAFVLTKPTNGASDMYYTPIKLSGITSKTKVESLSGEGISYGTKDMYTSEDGNLYLYLPAGTRTITVTANGRTYSGTVTTSSTEENTVVTFLN